MTLSIACHAQIVEDEPDVAMQFEECGGDGVLASGLDQADGEAA